MEFEEQEENMNLHEEEEEGDEEEEDDAVYDSPPPRTILKPTTEMNLETTGTTSTVGVGGGGFMVVHGGSGSRFRFRECLKNQAVNIGGHAVDGCGEFMPAGIEGTIDALKCAACGCHRNFHRKELPYFHHAPPQHHQTPPPPPGFYRLPAPVSYRPAPPSHQAPPLQLALPPPPTTQQQRERSEDRMETSSAEAGGGSGSGIRKRFRTKFTAEQKERMLGLAERIGWRIQRQDDEVIQRFCQETGVSRQVLKVWLHNNKHTLGKSTSPVHHQIHQIPPSSLAPPPPPPTHPHPHSQPSASYHHEQEQP